jgi:hypothetical protein
MTSEATPPHDVQNTATLLILQLVRGLYAHLCDALECADQDDNEYCLLLSNGADDLDSFISGIERLQEA